MPYNEQIRDEATDWFLRFCEQEVDGPRCKEFDSWLRTSPEHIRAYLDISAFWEAAGSMTRTRQIDVDKLVRLACADNNVVAFEQPRRVMADGRRKRLAPWRRVAIAASSLFFCLGLGAALWWQDTRDPTYATRVGEQRTISLSDGSTVELNARSRIRIRFTEATRGVDLLEGQALFHVAKNPARPFIVATGTTRVRAVGTQFDVNRKSTGTVVTVVEGKVSVSASRGPTLAAATPKVDAVLLVAGEQVTVTPRVLSAPTSADPAISTAWTQGKLVFDSTALGEVIEEFSRYNARPLFVDDPKLLNLHISGTFPTTDSTQLVHFLSERFGLVVHDTDEGIHLAHQ
jgi:transmembrane sensor